MTPFPVDEDYDEEEWDEDEEYEYEDEDAPAPRRRPKATSKRRAAPPDKDWRSGLALGFLAMLPLLIAYELADSDNRSTAEMVLLRGFSLLGPLETSARWATIGLAGVMAFVVAANGSRAVLPALGRIAAEGAALALLLGPALIGLHALMGVTTPALGDPSQVPSADRAAFVFGAAAWEELLFRVAAYSALYLIGRRLLGLVGASDRIATGTGEVLGIIGSAVLFAGAHLAAYTAWLGPGGEHYDLSVFTWRLLAGILLALIFRWRGPGVAAWTHGLFNLAILLGVGPDVFLRV